MYMYIIEQNVIQEKENIYMNIYEHILYIEFLICILYLYNQETIFYLKYWI